MAKQKTGFIKIKHSGFKKLFSKEELSSLLDMFKDNFNDANSVDIDWNKKHYLDYIGGTLNIPVYPETNISDDSEGLTPKQLKKLYSLLGIKNLGLFLRGLSSISTQFTNTKAMYSDGFISWKEVYKTHLSKKVDNKDFAFFGKVIFYNSIEYLHSLNSFSRPSKIHFPYIIDDNVYVKIAKNSSFLYKVLKLKENDIYSVDTILTIPLIDTDNYFKERTNIWKKENGFVPKNNKLLTLDTSLWNKTIFLNSMDILYGTRQLRKLDEDSINNFLELYKVFNTSLEFFAPILLKENIKAPQNRWPNLDKDISLKGIQKIINLSTKGINFKISVEKLLFMLRALSFFDGAEEDLLKKDTISVDNLNDLDDIGRNAIGVFKENPEYLKFISWENILLFKKVNLSWGQINEYLELFEETKDIKLKKIPLLKGSYGDYTYEILPKSDIRGLICGLATNCCQHLSNVGASCTLYGAYTDNSTFFIISKNGEIVAQSWLWLSYDNKTMVCDSIESLSNSENVISCYKAMAKDVFSSSKIKRVHCGDSPFYDSLDEVDDDVDIPECPDNIYDRLIDDEDMEIEDGLYSDAHSQYLIAKKS